MINRILHSRSFHLKCIKLAEGSFDKFHMKWPLVQDPLYARLLLYDDIPMMTTTSQERHKYDAKFKI